MVNEPFGEEILARTLIFMRAKMIILNSKLYDKTRVKTFAGGEITRQREAIAREIEIKSLNQRYFFKH